VQKKDVKYITCNKCKRTAKEVREKDAQITQKVKNKGYNVIRIWQCDLDNFELLNSIKEILCKTKSVSITPVII